MATSKSTTAKKTSTAAKPAAKKTSASAATTAKKTAAATPAARKPVAAKKPAVAKKPTTAAKPAATKSVSAPSPEQRYRMVQEAAYFIAEKNGFVAGSLEYWIAAEAEIDALLTGKARKK